MKCEHCGKDLRDGEGQDVQGEQWCCECFKNSTSCCERCGDAYPTEDGVEVGRQFWCPACADDHSVICERCGERVSDEKTESVGDEVWCSRCVEHYSHACEHCGELFRADSLICTAHEDLICSDCFYGAYGRCEGCDRIFPVSELERGRCPDCTNGAISDYGYKPSPIFHSTEKKPQENLFYGVEVEVEGNNERDIEEDAQELIDRVDPNENLFYLKADGSIKYGFEVVTHPCTLEYHQTVYPWEKICSFLQSRRYRSHETDTCGLHIHVSRKPLLVSTQIKVGLFAGFCADQLQTFGRRDYNSYCRKKSLRGTHKINAAYSEGRYEAVNFCNHKTIEFRFFRGTLRKYTILASIELIDALICFTKENPFPVFTSNCWKQFCEYVLKNHKRYQTLINYLKQKNLWG